MRRTTGQNAAALLAGVALIYLIPLTLSWRSMRHDGLFSGIVGHPGWVFLAMVPVPFLTLFVMSRNRIGTRVGKVVWPLIAFAPIPVFLEALTYWSRPVHFGSTGEPSGAALIVMGGPIVLTAISASAVLALARGRLEGKA